MVRLLAALLLSLALSGALSWQLAPSPSLARGSLRRLTLPLPMRLSDRLRVDRLTEVTPSTSTSDQALGQPDARRSGRGRGRWMDMMLDRLKAPKQAASLSPPSSLRSRSLSAPSTIRLAASPSDQLVEEQQQQTEQPQPHLLPIHPGIVRGALSNGLSYIILPNAPASGWFEAYLEILSGSAHELEQQQGMAHLLEHVAYMGAPHRQILVGTGSRTNAFTDFHHTVFYASCPTVAARDSLWQKPSLPMALDALHDVMIATIDEKRLEIERQAVLSEGIMINKILYRTERALLSALHPENRISKRFPIGKEEQIHTWSKEAVSIYHMTHYQPDNAILYIVGDVGNADDVVKSIQEKFGSLKSTNLLKTLYSDRREFPEVSMRDVNRHFPPVVHNWSCSKARASKLLAGAIAKDNRLAKLLIPPAPTTDILPKPVIFAHELHQGFSFHILAKRPFEPIVTREALRHDLMKRIALAALQVRLNVILRKDPLFTLVDFNQLDWPREGCAACVVDIATDLACWQGAVKLAVREIRRLGKLGLTSSELRRYKKAIVADAKQAAGQSDQMNSEAVLQELMESEACGHVYMHHVQRYEETVAAIETITLEDINDVANELCEHLCDIDADKGVKPTGILACVPPTDRDGNAFSITEQQITDTILEALSEEIQPPEDIVVPDTLIPADLLAEKLAANPPRWVDVNGKAAQANQLGVVQKMLSNGIKVNLKSLPSERDKAMLRLYVPGGRLRESREKVGDVLLGARTMQEGGAFLNMTREEVELFCIDNMVTVEIIATDSALIFDFQTMTNGDAPGQVSGMEGALQVMHVLLTDFKFEEDAMERARQVLHEQFDYTIKTLESACTERVVDSLFQGNTRFLCPQHDQIRELDLETIQKAIAAQLVPENVEVSIAGDSPVPVMEQLALNYLGSVPPSVSTTSNSPFVAEPLVVTSLGKTQQLGVYLPDMEERAMGYIAGPCANAWGIFADGSTLGDAMVKAGKNSTHSSHPMFGRVVLSVLQEIINRRLFSVVREEKRLTYDASFQLKGDDVMPGGWYLISVTSSPLKVQEAVRACKDALNSLKEAFGVMSDVVQSVKKSLIDRYVNDNPTNRFWVDLMTGSQIDCSAKTLQSCVDYEKVVRSVTVSDVQFLIECLRFEEDNMTTCIGISSSEPPEEASM